MSIRVKCKCGQGLSVPDDKPKVGKVPKMRRSHPHTSPQISQSKPVAKVGSLTNAPAANPLGGIDELLEEAGLSHRVGNFCRAAIHPSPMVPSFVFNVE